MDYRSLLNAHYDQVTLYLSQKADSEFRDFEAQIEAQLGEGGTLHEISGWGSKLPGQALRLAGLLHVAEHGFTGSMQITLDTMVKALNLASHLITHALVAFSLMQVDQKLRGAQKVMTYLARQSTKSSWGLSEIRHLTRSCRSLKGDSLRQALAWLEENYYLRRSLGEGGRHGQGLERYELNPKVLNQRSGEHGEYDEPEPSTSSPSSCSAVYESRI